MQKLWRLPSGEIIGGVGTAHDIFKMKLWVTEGRNPDRFPKVSDTSNFIIVTKLSGLVRYTNSPTPIEHGFNKCAFGSGREFAYGALFAGANATVAVKAACEFATHCGNGVDTFTI